VNKREFQKKVRKNKVARLEKKQGVKSGSTFRSILRKKKKEPVDVLDGLNKMVETILKF